jgi:hypothetical protein
MSGAVLIGGGMIRNWKARSKPGDQGMLAALETR